MFNQFIPAVSNFYCFFLKFFLFPCVTQGNRKTSCVMHYIIEFKSVVFLFVLNVCLFPCVVHHVQRYTQFKQAGSKFDVF